MRVKYINKKLKKLPPDKRKLLEKHINKLTQKIYEYGTDFDLIFNDSSVKYDKYSNNFYSAKFHGKISMRVLYRIDRDTIEIHMIHFKHENRGEYIRKFDDYSRNHGL